MVLSVGSGRGDVLAKTLFRVLALLYCIGFVVYFYMRAAFSLGSEHLAWRIIVLVIEFVASWSVLFLVLIRIKKPWSQFLYQDVHAVHRAVLRHKPDPETSIHEEEAIVLDRSFVVRILVPCYKEPLEIIQKTITAALNLNYDSSRLFVYLCDDGADDNKMNWILEMQRQFPNLGYIRRPKEFKGHSKGGNLNYALQQIIYPEAGKLAKEEAYKVISSKELVGVFDADMVALPQYLDRLIPYFSKDETMMAVQTPQSFHNVPYNADFWDCHNVAFFQYMLPAMDAWNTTTCCGTNFLVSARYLSRIGWFPYISITEDFAMAVKLHDTCGGRFAYHAEHLSAGEAPEDIRMIFQQRSRWAKGNFQLFVKQNPLFDHGLDFTQRILFFNAGWCYVSSAFLNPMFVVINGVAILFGLFPVGNVGFSEAMVFVSYYILFYLMIHFTPLPSEHYLSLWVNSKMGTYFSFMSMKAINSVIQSQLFQKTLAFKVTDKKIASADNQKSEKVEQAKDSSRDSSRKDIFFHVIMAVLLSLCIAYALLVTFGITSAFIPEVVDSRSSTEKSGLRLFCMMWLVSFLIAYLMPILYAILPTSYAWHKRTLMLLAFLDSGVNLGLIVITICLFNFPWRS